jgi:hypothetical protein
VGAGKGSGVVLNKLAVHCRLRPVRVRVRVFIRVTAPLRVRVRVRVKDGVKDRVYMRVTALRGEIPSEVHT